MLMVLLVPEVETEVLLIPGCFGPEKVIVVFPTVLALNLSFNKFFFPFIAEFPLKSRPPITKPFKDISYGANDV